MELLLFSLVRKLCGGNEVSFGAMLWGGKWSSVREFNNCVGCCVFCFSFYGVLMQ